MKRWAMASVLAGAVLVQVPHAFSAPEDPLLKCKPEEITEAQALAVKVKALSLTDPAAALKIAEDVARKRKSCFQIAFGAVLDGTGVASTGPGVPPSNS